MISTKIFKKRWFAAIVITMLWLSHFGDILEHDSTWLFFIYATINTLGQIAVFYACKLYYLSEDSDTRNKKNLWWWFTIITLTLAVSESVHMINTESDINWLLEPNIIIIEAIISIIDTALFVALTLIISMAYVYFQKDKQNKVAIAKLETLNKTTELNALKSQINPHFLFNALSNIYSIAYFGDKETPTKIGQLSRMLRYVLYECSADKVRLEQEINYLEEYIDFQKFKIKTEQHINFNHTECNQNIKIAPMILLPFVENAFKHSHSGVDKNAQIDIDIKTDNTHFIFIVENTKSLKKQEIMVSSEGGIGLSNIHKRLDMIYGKNYTLDIENKDTFKIELKIELKRWEKK